MLTVQTTAALVGFHLTTPSSSTKVLLIVVLVVQLVAYLCGLTSMLLGHWNPGTTQAFAHIGFAFTTLGYILMVANALESYRDYRIPFWCCLVRLDYLLSAHLVPTLYQCMLLVGQQLPVTMVINPNLLLNLCTLFAFAKKKKKSPTIPFQAKAEANKWSIQLLYLIAFIGALGF